MSDAYNGLVTLLLRMEGVNGSPYFRDDSNFPKIVTVNGNAAISTAQSKWGYGSGYFDGSGDFLTIPASAAFNIGTGDFTFELWIYIAGNSPLDRNNNRQADVFRLDEDSASLIEISGSASTTGTGFSIWDGSHWGGVDATISQNAWHHLAQSRKNGVVYSFLDGNAVGSGYNYAYSLGVSNKTLYVGGRDVAGWERPLNGYIQDMRLTLACRYISSFTPPPRLENPANPLNLSLTTQYYDASGGYWIKGSVDELGVAGSYRVRLFERRTGRCVRETWSAADGSYSFPYIAYRYQGYFVVAFDHGDNPLNAAIADLITPELMP